MKKRIGLNLDGQIVESIKGLLENKRMYSKAVTYFLQNEYKPPTTLKEDELEEAKYELIQFDEVSLNLLDRWCKQLNISRSALMRDVTQKLELALKQEKMKISSKRKPSSFYFESGTKDILDRLIPFNDRNITIEQFILHDYKPIKDTKALKKRPLEVESIRIYLNGAAFDKLKDLVREIDIKGITQAALMRDVINQLIKKLSNSEAHKLVLEQRLESTIEEYQNKYGQDQIKEKLKTYVEGEDENKKL